MNMLLLVHGLITWALVGLIWTIQVVHYPLFKQVGRDAFAQYHALHTWRISVLVMPAMLLEVGSAACLLWLGERHPVFLLSLFFLAVIWLSTWLQQVPCHDRLSQGFDDATHRRLVRTNLWRTLSWTLRGLGLALLLAQRLT